MAHARLASVLLALSLSVTGCRCTVDSGNDAGPEDAGPGPVDAGRDAGVDAGFVDAGVDAGPLDAGVDAGVDAGTLDAGFDAGQLDAGFDAGQLDAGFDAGPLDAGFDAGTLDAGPMGPGSLAGRVVEWGGCELTPVGDAGVELLVPGGRRVLTRTDETGRFTFLGVDAGRFQVAVQGNDDEQSPTASHQLPVTVFPAQRSELSFVLAPACTVADDLVADGGAIRLETSCWSGTRVAVELTSGDLVLPDGGRFVGLVRATFAAPPFLTLDDGGMDLSSLQVMPGAMQARLATDAGALLESFGPAEIRLVSVATAERLQVAPGRTVGVWMSAAPTDGGASVPAFRFVPDDGRWVQQGTATLSTLGGLPAWSMRVDHLSWWNPDVPLSAISCVRGRVTQFGQPQPGVDVTGYGVRSAFSVREDVRSDGTFCMDTKVDQDLWVVARRSTAGLLPVFDAQAQRQVRSGPGGQRCGIDPTACVDVGDLVLVEPVAACVTGRVVDRGQDPLPDGGFPGRAGRFNVEGEPPVRRGRQCGTVRLGALQTDGDGNFCAAVPFGLVSAELYDPQQSCSVSLGAAPTDAGVCGGATSCQSLGDVDFFCGS